MLCFLGLGAINIVNRLYKIPTKAYIVFHNTPVFGDAEGAKPLTTRPS